MKSLFKSKLLCFLIVCSFSATAQTQTVELPTLTIKDTVLADILGIYTQSGLRRVKVKMVPNQDTLSYYISPIYFYEDAKSNPTNYWGLWRNSVLLFCSQNSLSEVVTTAGNTDFSLLLKHLRPILSDGVTFYKSDVKGETLKSITSAHGPEWEVKIRNGKLVSWKTNYGFDLKNLIK